MENKTYEDGVKDEYDRIVAYLFEKNVLREALFYEGYVAYLTDGTKAIDLPITLGGNK